MAFTKKQEERALSADERDLVAKTHHPALQDLSDADLAETIKLVRERRDKATSLAHQRRREMRGKEAPRGASASRRDDGSRVKVSVLAAAVSRLNSEVARRRRMSARIAMVENARKALEMKQSASDSYAQPYNTRRMHEGMRAVATQRRENLIRTMERGRLRKAAATAQAKRDSR